MFRKNDQPVQISLANPELWLSNKQQELLKNSWAYTFAEEIFPAIDEETFAPLYSSDSASRPNVPVNQLVGAMIIKEIFNMSDADIVFATNFYTDVRMALHIENCDEMPFCERTFKRFRERNLAYAKETGVDLLKECVVTLSQQLADLMNIDGRLRRMDSLEIASNIRTLSRSELIYECLAKLLKKMMADQLLEVPEEFAHYVDPNDFNKTFYTRHSNENADTLQQILNDCDRILAICGNDYVNVKEYQVFVRCLSEQTVKEENGRRLSTKKDGNLNAEVLQNPSDPDATYREKAGKSYRGYVANVDEAVSENGSIILDYQVEQNTYSDSQLFGDTVERAEPSEDATLYVTDGAYASQENVDKAAEKNITLVTTSLTGKETADILADFEFSEDGTAMIACPEGEEPVKQSYSPATNQVSAVFDGARCAACPRCNECPFKLNKQGTKATVKTSRTASNRAKTQRIIKSEDFGPYQRLRNGVETIPSILRRKYQVDRMDRGIYRVRFRLGCKIAALNINKFFRFRKGLLKPAANPLLS